MENPIPEFEMPTDFMRKTFIVASITLMVSKQISVEVTDDKTGKKVGRILDYRTCAALIVGNDDVKAVTDPNLMRSRLANSEFRARVLRIWPDVRVLYQDKPRD